MRVLMIGLDLRQFGQGSVRGDVVERHQKYADKAGYLDVIVFTPPGYSSRKWSGNYRVFPTNTGKIFQIRRAAALAAELCSRKPYDLVITQDFAAPVGSRLKKRFSTPWLVTIHGLFFARQWLKYDPKKWIHFFLIKKAIRLADAFRVTNKVIEYQLRRWGIDKPVIVEPTPVDISKFQITNNKFQTKTILQVLYVGRLSSEKNVKMLIRAYKNTEDKTQNTELLIVGEGPEETKLKKQAGSDKRIRFLGKKTHEELVRIYQGADIFVLPSDTESFGWVLVEAAAAGCAVIATRTAGAESILEDGKSALLVTASDPEAMRLAMERLIADPDLRKKLAAGAGAETGKYDQDKSIARLVEFWKKVAMAGGQPR